MDDEINARLEAIEKRLALLEGRRRDSELTGFKLCYVESGYAYFTTCPLDKQWGDDWNDAPYEHNAGAPYEWRPYMLEKNGTPEYEICRIRFDGMATPTDRAWSGNSHYSVDQINTGVVAWLTDEKSIHIFAGASIEEFKQKVRAAGGNVYKEDVTEESA